MLKLYNNPALQGIWKLSNDTGLLNHYPGFFIINWNSAPSNETQLHHSNPAIAFQEPFSYRPFEKKSIFDNFLISPRSGKAGHFLHFSKWRSALLYQSIMSWCHADVLFSFKLLLQNARSVSQMRISFNICSYNGLKCHSPGRLIQPFLSFPRNHIIMLIIKNNDISQNINARYSSKKWHSKKGRNN